MAISKTIKARSASKSSTSNSDSKVKSSSRSSKSSSSKSNAGKVSSSKVSSKSKSKPSTEVVIGEYAGKPIFGIHTIDADGEVSERPAFSFGLTKAKLIVAHLEELQEFIKNNK